MSSMYRAPGGNQSILQGKRFLPLVVIIHPELERNDNQLSPSHPETCSQAVTLMAHGDKASAQLDNSDLSLE